jgi:5,10-methylenetetrahydrofolate reductase
MPNAGYPHRVDDRTVYESAPSYFARFARSFVELGATVIGGCCGTTPEHIAAMAPEVVGKNIRPRARRGPVPARTGSARSSGTASFARPDSAAPPAPTAFERKLGKEFVITAEVSPPRGIDLGASLAAAKLLQSVGVDAIHITDNPTARLRMSGMTVAHLLMRETGVAAILHFSCRDRNLLGLQSELLGAAALRIPAILALTGDPSNIGDFPKATSVFDVTALGLTRILRSLNGGRDHAGNDIGPPTHFRIGTAVNPVPRDLAGECAKFDEKIAAGADFAVTQPVFDTDAMRPFLEHSGRAGIPLLVGLLPLRSYANAEYLHNEVPGMHVPEAIRERLHGAADERREGIAIARDLLAQFSATPGIAGVYIVSQEQYDLVAEVVSGSLQARSAPR